MNTIGITSLPIAEYQRKQEKSSRYGKPLSLHREGSGVYHSSVHHMDLLNSLSTASEIAGQLFANLANERNAHHMPGVLTKEFFGQKGATVNWDDLALQLENTFTAAQNAGFSVVNIETEYDIIRGPLVRVMFEQKAGTRLFPRLVDAQLSITIDEYVKKWQGAPFISQANCLGGIGGAFAVIATPAATNGDALVHLK